MENDRLSGLLGLCQRAGKLQSGADLALKAIRGGSCRLALLDADAAPGTVKKITDACIYYRVPLITLPADLLSSACGREGRMAAAVLDPGFAEAMKPLCSANETIQTK